VAGTCQLDVPRDADLDTPRFDASSDAVALPCDLAEFACGVGAKVFMCGTTCYARCNASVNSAAAQTRCQAWSGRLGEIPDAETNACVTDGIAGRAWIGLAQSADATTPADGWTWNGTTPVTFAGWHDGRPDDADGSENKQEQCGALDTDGTWDDTPCGFNGLAFVCQR
jgi:hypothetical protein